MKPVAENLGVLFSLMKTTWGSWSTEPEGCIVFLPLLSGRCDFLQAVSAKTQVSSAGAGIACCAALAAAPRCRGLRFATRSEARRFLQPASRHLGCGGAFLQTNKKKRGGAFAFSSLVFHALL